MPKKPSQGIQIYPQGVKFPNVEQGNGQRPFTPDMKSGKGPQVADTGHRFGATGDADMQKGHQPGSVPSKGPQTHASSRFGDTNNNNQDPSRPYNP